MADAEKVIKGLECCDKKYPRNAWCKYCPYEPDCLHDSTCDLLIHDALKLLKAQQALKEKLLRNIADQQLAVSPTGYETEEGLAKRTGEWNGLQMAYEIVKNEGN